MNLRQYVLESDGFKLTCWLEVGRCKVGDVITLKDHFYFDKEKKWRVKKESSKVMDRKKVRKHTVFEFIKE